MINNSPSNRGKGLSLKQIFVITGNLVPRAVASAPPFPPPAGATPLVLKLCLLLC